MPKKIIVKDPNTGKNVNVAPFFQMVKEQYFGDYDALVSSYRNTQLMTDSKSPSSVLLGLVADTFRDMVVDQKRG